jgi:hypothetical protein
LASDTIERASGSVSEILRFGLLGRLDFDGLHPAPLLAQRLALVLEPVSLGDELARLRAVGLLQDIEVALMLSSICLLRASTLAGAAMNSSSDSGSSVTWCRS